MQTKRLKGWILIVIFGLLGAFFIAGVSVKLGQLPEEIYLIGDNSRVLDVGLPMSMTLKEAKQQSDLTINGVPIHEQRVTASTLEIQGDTEESAQVQLKLFGWLPVKNIQVTAVEKKILIPGGQSIGVMLHTQGALIVGMGEITKEDGTICNPAQSAGLQAGDVIIEYNDILIEDSTHLARLIQQYGEAAIDVTVLRAGVRHTYELRAVLDSKTNEYKLGTWMRDSTIGVGTLTFYDPESNCIAGLGHAITDYDTGEVLTVREGKIVTSQIVDVIPGESGKPGELKGTFASNGNVLGTISMNTEYGIYGEAEKTLQNHLYSYMEAADRTEVKRGDATLLCTVQGDEVKEYSCKITKVYQQDTLTQKNFMVEIDDPALLEYTGGIVQGMSGSPIIQDGKLVGAVTHVLVNDPTRGYGIFIENMLDAAG